MKKATMHSKHLVKTAIVIAFACIFNNQPSFAGELEKTVKTIDWSRFKEIKKNSEEFQLSSKINTNAGKYAMIWLNEAYESSENNDQFIYPNKYKQYYNGNINNDLIFRPTTSAALGLAVALRTGIDPTVMGTTREELIETVSKVLKGTALNHHTNGGNWGTNWQTPLISSQMGRTVWLLWDEIDEEVRELVCRVVVYEANRHIKSDYKVPYWNGKGGDTKAEENSWCANGVQQAIVMMPDHPNCEKWKNVLCELQMSSYSLETDMQKTEPLFDSKSPNEWLKGYNVRQDSLVINHNLIHNDYMVSFTHCQMSGFMVFSLAGLPVPQSTDFNFELIYKTLVTKKFDTPPFEKPGGTMYIPGKPEQYYPQGTDWSVHRFACFYSTDIIADVLGYDKKLPFTAKHWAKLRGEKILEMQSRHENGQMYANGEWDNYKNREFMTFWTISDTQLFLWLNDRNAISRRDNLFKK